MSAARLASRLVGGRLLRFEHSPPNAFQEIDAVGTRVWPCADVLVDYFETGGGRGLLKGKRVLELGSGCGYVGISVALLGARQVLLTDRLVTGKAVSYDAEGVLREDEAGGDPRILLDLCERNVALNQAALTGAAADVSATELNWDENEGVGAAAADPRFASADLLIGSDCTYNVNFSESLFRTVSRLLQQSGVKEASFIASHQHRLQSSLITTLESASACGLAHRVLHEVQDHQHQRKFSVFEFRACS